MEKIDENEDFFNIVLDVYKINCKFKKRKLEFIR